MKILVLLPSYNYSKTVEPLGRIDYNTGLFLRDPKSYGLVLFTGGDDVSPSLYKHKRFPLTYADEKRDLLELKIAEVAIQNEVPMIGICRGFQFLNVCNRGFLIQHVIEHGGCIHQVKSFDGNVFQVNSLHHQMVYPSLDTFVMAVSHNIRSEVHFVDTGLNEKFKGTPKYYRHSDASMPDFPTVEVEAAYFPKIQAFGVQWHPEMMSSDELPGVKYFTNFAKLLIRRELESVLKGSYCPTMYNIMKYRKGLSGIIYDEVRKVLYAKSKSGKFHQVSGKE